VLDGVDGRREDLYAAAVQANAVVGKELEGFGVQGVLHF
jgi:hypothetical protein